MHRPSRVDRQVMRGYALIPQYADHQPEGQCPVCRFPYQLTDGMRVHDKRARYATARYGCDDVAVSSRPPRPH